MRESKTPGHIVPTVPNFYLPELKKILFIFSIFLLVCRGLMAQVDSSKHKRVMVVTDSIIATLEGPKVEVDMKQVTAKTLTIRSRTTAPYNMFLNHEYASYLEQGLNDTSRKIHTTFRPLIQSDLSQYVNIDSLNGYNFPAEKKSWLYRKLFQENLFTIYDTSAKFFCTIDPLFNFQGSMDYSDSSKKYYQNSRGILVQGNVGTNFAFSSTFWENQADYPTYINQFIQENQVIPGNGRTKAFGTNGYDFSMSEAYLSYSPSSHFDFQGGYGKNFIGDGYRSLLLSDNSFAYPYVRITTTFWHMQYTNLYALLSDPFADPSILANNEGLFQRKAAAFQYLSWYINPRAEWGIFQSIMWPAANSYNQMALNANYFDPLLFGNTIRYGVGNTNNVYVGSTLKYKFSQHFMAYGQLMVNDVPQNLKLVSFNNRTAHQTGVKYFNTVGKFQGVLQLEYDEARPYTYEGKDSLDSYSNYNQPLGDPMGANFREFIIILHIRYRHFSINLQGDYVNQGSDSTNTNFGNDVLVPFPSGSPSHIMLAGIKSTMEYMDIHISYLLNPRTNMNFTLGISRRTYTSSDAVYNEPSMTLFYVGFRTSIENMYVDF